MISYSQCWEDAEVLTKALDPSENDTILSVSSGGCNTLALAASGAKTVFAVDSNSHQNYVLELKQAAVKTLPYSSLLGFLGYQPCSNRLELYRSVAPNLSLEAQLFWEKNRKAVANGAVHAGKFERYLWAFRNIVLPCVHTRKRVRTLLCPSSSREQETFYSKQWNTPRWRLLFKLFFSRKVMQGNGRSKEMFNHSNSIPTAKLFFLRTQRALKHGNVSNNFYLSYVLLGKRSKVIPYYLQEHMVESIKKQCNVVLETNDIHTFLCQMPNESIDKFNLSDIFEPLTTEKSNAIFAEVARTSKVGARIIFWNNLVYRDVPSNLTGKLVRDIDAESELQKIDRVFFYEKFYIYEKKE